MAKHKLTEAQVLLAEHLRELGFESIVHEFRICLQRRWRADIAGSYYGRPYLFEADGGKWRGGHTRGNALERDYEKQNWAQVRGYKILRFTNQQILDGRAKQWLKENL